jgi:hypothetical protein
MIDADAASANEDRILELVRQIGARRFEAEVLAMRAFFLALGGRRSEAMDLTRRGAHQNNQ